MQYNRPFPESPGARADETEHVKKAWQELKKLMAACQLKGAILFFVGEKFIGALADACDDPCEATLTALEIAKRGIINEFSSAERRLDALDALESGSQPAIVAPSSAATPG